MLITYLISFRVLFILIPFLANATGFSPRNLARMRKYYETYRDLSNLPMPLAKLPWSFNCLSIDKIEDICKRIWHAKECLDNGWSYIVLDHQIDFQLYERQGESQMNNYLEEKRIESNRCFFPPV